MLTTEWLSLSRAGGGGGVRRHSFSLSEYCNIWSLHVNSQKTKIVVFSMGKVRKIPSFQFNNQKLSVVDDYVYLGVTFNYNNKFRKAQTKQLLNQARRAMYSLLFIWTCQLIYCWNYLTNYSFQSFCMAAKSWDSKLYGISKFSTCSVKKKLMLNKSTANCMVLGELGISLEKYTSNIEWYISGVI